jgi:sorbitol-specific phosphotransferase system component IIA
MYGDAPENTAFLVQMSLITVLTVVVMLLPYAYPVWILRNRIRDKKIAEMGQITLARRGDKNAVKTINIHALDAPTTAADLLTHRMFLDSLWEWPR